MNPDLTIGAIYQGRFRVHSQLGVGETSRVFLLDDLQLGRRVVLKRGVASQQIPADRLRSIFENERDILLTLPRDVHPDLFDPQLDVPELFLEYVAAPSLEAYFRDWISPNPQSFPREAQLLEVANSLVRRVAACHAHQVIVADLKPEHILVLVEPSSSTPRPPTPSVFKYLVTCLKRLNRHKEALEVVARGLEQHPQDVSLREFFNRISQPPGRSIRR